VEKIRDVVAGLFREKLGVSMSGAGNHIENLIVTDLTPCHIRRGLGYRISLNFPVKAGKARMST
jgi:hypothetical protein